MTKLLHPALSHRQPGQGAAHRHDDERRRPATCFVVLKLGPNDNGMAPRQWDGRHINVELFDLDDPAAPGLFRISVGGHYGVRCNVHNLGDAPVLFGMCRWHAIPMHMIGSETELPPAGGTMPYTLEGRSEATLVFPRPFVPTSDHVGRLGILVVGEDLLADPGGNPFDFDNRHRASALFRCD